MYFFLVVGGGMAVAIFLIYQLCRLAHIEVKLSSLVLCAVLALVVNVLAVKMSPFLDRGHYIRLGLMVVAAAAVVTVFNERLLRREEALAAGTKEAVLSAIKKPLPWEGAGEESVADESAATAEAVEEAGAADATPPEQAASEPSAANGAAAEPGASADVTATEDSAADVKPVLEVRPTESEAHAYASEQVTVRARGKETAEIVETERLEEAQEKTQALAAELEAEEERRREENLARLQEEREAAAAAEKAAQEAKLAAEQAEREAKAAAEQAAQEAKAAESAEREQYRAAVAELTSLDDILDYIYEVKAERPLAAAVAYGEAITRFADDSYTPFLIIELSTLYREQGDYAGAIRTYEHALTLPIIAASGAMQSEMTKNLGYLRTVSDILTAHQAQSTPFAAIPAEIKQEIEAEFEARCAKSMGE